MRTKTAEKIGKFISKKGQASPNLLGQHFKISRQALFRQLKKLLLQGKIIKIGSAPKVIYKVVDDLVSLKSEKIHDTINKRVGKIPEYVKPFLWSYNLNKLNLEKNKKRIITNVLNYGDRPATDWLQNNFSGREIKEVLQYPLPGEWSKRSYNFWAMFYGVDSLIQPREVSK